MRRHRVVRVPASSANLGPGYDALAAALSLSLEVEVAETGEELVVDCDVPGVPCDRTNLCVRAFERLHPADGLYFRIRSQIPVASGLGSSAAAIVAGLVAADHMFELDARLFELAAEIEGHPDNVAPAVFGGLTVAWHDAAGYRAARLTMSAPVRLVAFVPSHPVETLVARGLLPVEVPHRDAAHNAGRAGLLVAALTGQLGRQSTPELTAALMAATDDRLHQPYRESAMPDSAALTRRLRAQGVPAVISGAGPTVLALLPSLETEDPDAPSGWATMRLAVDAAGATLVG
jgi:homoserine kinase